MMVPFLQISSHMAPRAKQWQRVTLHKPSEVVCSMYARSFATLGMLYAGIECVIESHRGKHDMYNSLYTGFVTGGLLARGSAHQTPHLLDS